MIENKTCSVCESSNWKSLDYMRDKAYWIERNKLDFEEEVNFKICTECGYVTYDYMDEDFLAASYDRDRPVMQASNLITGARKNGYHRKFLEDIDFADKKIVDCGCATGDFLMWLEKERKCKKENLYGTEYNQHLGYFVEQEYGYNISKTLDESIKYDFISYYHVLEHIQRPEEQLKKCHDWLKDDGLLYLSIPFWFEELDEQSGILCDNFENYYHLNHIVVFSRQSFYNMLKKTGWEIIKEDDIMYGITVLCKKTEPSDDIAKEDFQKIEKIIRAQKKAIQLVSEKKYDESLKTYPAYPDCYIMKTLTSENMKEFDIQMEILAEAEKQCPKNQKIQEHKAKILFQWDERDPKRRDFYGNNVKTSKKLILNSLELKPGNEALFYFLGLIYARYEKEYDKGIEKLKEILEINPAKWQEIWTMIGSLYKEKYEWEKKA